MNKTHAKAAVLKAEGTLEVGLGKVTGDKRQEATGKARQVEGRAQDLLGDVQNAAHRSSGA